MTGTCRSRHYSKPKAEGDAKTRSCLRCRKDFLSAHRGNRICPDCTQANARAAPGLDVFAIPGHRERKEWQ
ncbi:MAG: hypothetical protein MI785_14925 [Kiloniellales bacterium]|nr:hypothetical protein [Kiloniellales bacterium]